MRLDELLQDLSLDKIADIAVTGISCDSRQVKAGSVFFALPGGSDSGERYMADAVRRGATAVVAEAGPPPVLAVPVVTVPDARMAFALASARWHGFPSRALYLAGVTGTNGKTTITYLLERLWGEGGTGVIGTVNARYAGCMEPASLTTPDACSLNALLARMRSAGMKRAVIEVSSHALSQGRVLGLDFDAAVFTNLTQDHLDYHRDMESYFAAKRGLFTELLQRSIKRAKLAVINTGDPYGRRLAAETQGVPVRTFSADGSTADLALKSARYSFLGTEAVLARRGREFPVRTNLIGCHNVLNVMAALSVAAEEDGDVRELAGRLAKVSVPGRLERIGDRPVFVDYAHTPDALENVLNALVAVRREDPVPRRLVTVFGCGGDRDRGKRPLMGAIAARLSDVVVVTSDNPRTEEPQAIIADILRGIPEVASGGKCLVEADRTKALARAMEIAGREDIVLVAGKGHEDYQIVGRERRPFDDGKVLEGLLR